MRLHQLSCFGFSALLLGLGSACGGGQTGDLSGKNDGNGQETGHNASQGCDEHRTELTSFDEETSAGSARELLSYAERRFDAPITWKEPAEGQFWNAAPESGEGALHIEVTRGAKAYQLTYTASQSENGEEVAAVGVICPPPQLGVEAHVTVTTDGGALAESFDTLLRATTPGVATLSVPLKLDQLTGDLAVSSSNPNAKLVQLGLDAVLAPAGTTGSISGLEQVTYGSGPDATASARQALLAVWPASAACEGKSPQGDGLGLSLSDEALGFSGTDTLASVTPPAAVDVTWLDGAHAELSVGIASSGDGCFWVRQSPIPSDAGPAAQYPVTVTLESDDGRLDGSYSGTVLASGSGDGRSVVASLTLSLPAADVAQSGFTQVTVPSGAESVLLQFESQRAGGSATGSVRLIALSSPPCSTQPQMSGPGGGAGVPGCAGQTRTDLEAASWAE